MLKPLSSSFTILMKIFINKKGTSLGQYLSYLEKNTHSKMFAIESSLLFMYLVATVVIGKALKMTKVEACLPHYSY